MNKSTNYLILNGNHRKCKGFRAGFSDSKSFSDLKRDKDLRDMARVLFVRLQKVLRHHKIHAIHDRPKARIP